MTDFYLDPVNGNDTNNGTTWALAWKTITAGATATRIAPGDKIKVAKSPDPASIGNATWNNLSKTVTLASALTANVDLCNTAWTANTYITTSLNTTVRKEGQYCLQIVPSTTFTTGKMAYKAIGSIVDYSGYQQISFWIRTSAVVAAGVLKICLCSDTAGDTIVDELVIPAMDSAAYNYPLTLDKGSALGAAIQSVAIYAITDPSTTTFNFDNIIACKASSSVDALSLTSLISKNSAPSGGDEGWYPIQSIDGATVSIDSGPASTSTSGRGYYGVTESVMTYRREAFRVAYTACAIQDSGIDGSLIEFQGGFNTATGEQDAETYFDVGSGRGNGIDFSSKKYVLTRRLNMVRAQYGIYLYSASYCEVTAHCLCDCGGAGIYLNSASFCKVAVKNANNNAGQGVLYAGTNVGNEITLINVNNNTSNGISLATAMVNKLTVENVCNNGAANVLLGANTIRNILTITNNQKSATYGFAFDGSPALDNKVIGTTTALNSFGAVSAASPGNQFFYGCAFGETIKVANQGAWVNSRVCLTAHDGSTDNNTVYTDGGIISSQSSVRHTASGIAWQLSPTSANRSAYYPLFMSLAKIAVAASTLVTVLCWFRRSDTGIIGKLVCRGGQIAGVTTDISASMTAAADTWEQLSISLSPATAGVIEIEVWAYGGTVYSVYVDDIEIRN